ncbi:MAG: nitrilase family protein [Balneolaceae bacterium]|nr:nitrilase family protein [Balneolaceae bacterium]
MKNLKITTVQFENRSLDKAYNLGRIDRLCAGAAEEGSNVVAFHECCISGYTIANSLSKEEMLDLAEIVPDGPSTEKLIRIAEKYGIHLLAGLYEKDEDQKLYNTYICVNGDGVVATYRKMHPFISSHLSPGNSYCLFQIEEWTCGILICYDNNIIENVRATNLLGADIIFMPHVTMCTPSTRPGAGFVDPELWKKRREDPTSLRLEFDGLKGRQWLMKWLPARAYDNAAYVVFANPIGMDEDQLKNGCSMIIDPFGDVIAECRKLDDDLATATITAKKLTDAGGHRYKKARRPDLYRDIIGAKHQSEQKVAWLNDGKK